MKKNLLLSMLISVIFSCKNNQEKPLEIKEKCPDLKEITVDVSNFDPSETNITNWLYVFSTTSSGNGSMNKVKIYTTPEELIKDTQQNASKIYQSNGGEYLGKVMAKRFKDLIDFTKFNLIVVHFTGSNSSNFKVETSCKNNVIEFCNTSSGAESLAKYYIIEKNNYTATICNPEICNKKWFWINTTKDKKKSHPKTRDIYAITFNNSGTFNIDSDCNLISGKYSFDKENNNFKFTSFEVGKEICENSQENEWIEDLKKIEKISFDENQNLILENETTKILLKIKQ